MDTTQDNQPSGTLASNVAMTVAALAVLSAAGFGLYKFSAYIVDKGDALALGLVVLVGLALIVALVAGLAIVYSMLDVENKDQALALPEGSVRALIAFSLLLIFVCLATFIYHGIAETEPVAAGKATRITAEEVAKLRQNFVVVAEVAPKEAPPPSAGGAAPRAAAATAEPVLYNASYFTRPHSKEADDIGKQIFTTLATVFVSVVSFYFGSSTTTSGMAALKKSGPEPSPTPSPAPTPAPTPTSTPASVQTVSAH